MIDPMNSGIAMSAPPQRIEQKLTNDQQSLIAEKFSEYAVDTLT
jgi:hypothetical protein